MSNPERKLRLVPVPSPFGPEATDADLVQGAAEGNKMALRVIWDRYLAPVRSTLRSCLGNDAAIDDLSQEVFLSFYRSAGRVRDPSALRPYLLGMATRLASFEIRSRARRHRWHRLFHWSRIGCSVGESEVDERDALRILHRVLASLPDREREAFVLRYVQDLSPAEVAQGLSMPLGTAKRAIAEGRRRVLLRARGEPALVQYLRGNQEHGR